MLPRLLVAYLDNRTSIVEVRFALFDAM